MRIFICEAHVGTAVNGKPISNLIQGRSHLGAVRFLQCTRQRNVDRCD